jgi:hypothetical protein
MNTSELRQLALAEAQERFPEAKITSGCAWYDMQFGTFRCSLFVNGMLAFGYGKSMNACCDDLLKNVAEQMNTEHETAIIYEL